MIKLQLVVHDATTMPSRNLSTLLDRACETVEAFRRENGFIECNIVDDERMTEINAAHRGKNHPTDVLSFGYLDLPGPKNVVGEVFIASGVASRQAAAHGHSLESEIKILFVHGILHLAGYRHDTDEQEEEMEGMARGILRL